MHFLTLLTLSVVAIDIKAQYYIKSNANNKNKFFFINSQLNSHNNYTIRNNNEYKLPISENASLEYDSNTNFLNIIKSTNNHHNSGLQNSKNHEKFNNISNVRQIANNNSNLNYHANRLEYASQSTTRHTVNNDYGFDVKIGNNFKLNEQNNSSSIYKSDKKNENINRNGHNFNKYSLETISSLQNDSIVKNVQNSRISSVKKRISQQMYEVYMKKIYGNYDQSFGIGSRVDGDKFDGRIVAEPGQYPHMAAIGFRTVSNSTIWQCGGSLIDQNFIITAAHCTEINGEKPFYVKIGDINLNYNEDDVDPQRFRIKNIYKYPKYSSLSYYNDIALLELKDPALFTEQVYPIQLWDNPNIPYKKVFAMGYGATAFGKAKTNILTHLNLTLVSNEECNKSVPKNSKTQKGIIESQICAFDSIANRDTCQGDSGGPLQLNREGKKHIEYQLIGITSYGTACGGSSPSVYTRVSSYLDWIEEIVWPNFKYGKI